MNEVQRLEAFLELARELGLEVRVVGARAGRNESFAESPPASALCRVRGRLWVVLSVADPVSVQIEVLARALHLHAGAALDERHLPPALRLHLEAAAAKIGRHGDDRGGSGAS
jgi:hypothetical protein